MSLQLILLRFGIEVSNYFDSTVGLIGSHYASWRVKVRGVYGLSS